MLFPTDIESYEALIAGFRWQLPARFNLAEAVCDRHARQSPDATAMILDRGDGDRQHLSFGELKQRSDRVAAGLARLGVETGDRVATTLGQGFEVLITHLAAFKLGAISVPIAGVYGIEGLTYRLQDCGAKVLVTDAAGVEKLRQGHRPATVEHLVVRDQEPPAGSMSFEELLAADPLVRGANSRADDPALIFYTSGTSGNAKGVLHAHRVLLGYLPGFQMVFELAPRPGDIFWPPSDWSWIGSLIELVLPALYCGHPVVAAPGRFSPQRAYQIMADNRVTCPFLAPTALRIMRGSPPGEDVELVLRAIMTGGEASSPEVLAWAEATLGAPLNDIYGLTEANHAAAGCAALFATPPGAIGRMPPGRRLAILDPQGHPLPPETSGEIALWRDDPIIMLGYWNQPLQAGEVSTDGWIRTGDAGLIDGDGFLHFDGRLDDVIISAGYRIGPEEVERQLLAHDAVLEVGVIGSPDAVVGQAVTAFVVLRPGLDASDELAEELKAFVKRRLGAHAYPRGIAFVDALPKTTSGKIRRAALR